MKSKKAPVMNFIELVQRSHDYKYKDDLEKEVERLVAAPDMRELYYARNLHDFPVVLYLCKVIELRIRRKVEISGDPHEEIEFITELYMMRDTHHVLDVFAMAGALFWPVIFPNFLNLIFTNLTASQASNNTTASSSGNGFNTASINQGNFSNSSYDFVNSNNNSFMNAEKGYKALLFFLRRINEGTEIDDKRRTELKTAVRGLVKEFCMMFDVNKYAGFIIEIHTELLKIAGSAHDYSVVYEKTGEFPNEAIDFFITAGNSVDSGRLSNVLWMLPPDCGMVSLLCGLRMDSVNTDKCVEYVSRSLYEDPYCVMPAVDYFSKISWGDKYARFIKPVMNEVMHRYLEMDDLEKEEIFGPINGLFGTMAKSNANECISFLLENENYLSEKIIANFLQKIFKIRFISNGNGSKSVNLTEHTSFSTTITSTSTNSETATNYMFTRIFFTSSDYLNCLVAYLMDDCTQALNLVKSLNFQNDEVAKLVVKIINKFNVGRDDLLWILEKCDDFNGRYSFGCANEIWVECFLRLGQPCLFKDDGKEWSTNDVLRFYYLLKRAPEKCQMYTGAYLSTFSLYSPFDRCFAILQMLGSTAYFAVIDFIYAQITGKFPDPGFFQRLCFGDQGFTQFQLPTRPGPLICLDDLNLSCFNTDLLGYLPAPAKKIFIEAEVTRFVSEWDKPRDDFNAYYLAVKTLINIIGANIDTPGIIDLLFDLFTIEHSVIVNRCLSIFNKYTGTFPTDKAVFKLLTIYRSPYLCDTQPQTITGLVLAISQKNGPDVFSYFFDMDITKCRDIQLSILKSNNKKTAQNIMRNLLKNFRGKPLHELFRDTVKGKKQNFLKQTPTL